MRQSALSVHSENILPIIKKWLYSERDVFLRELVSNATDALHKIQILGERGEAAVDPSALKISIQTDPKRRTLAIADTGLGMTEGEVERYIAQIAFSGAEEFVAKYKSVAEQDPIIGHFGLGFYSAYMVAAKVEIDTVSYLPDAGAVFWSCDGSSSYTIGQGERRERGTQVTLFLDEASGEYLEEAKLKELLLRYCQFMPFPIELNGRPIGNQPPLWVKNPSECSEKEYRAFYRQLFPLDPDPLFWVHLNVDYPFHLKGILFFPKIHRRFHANESTIRLFCNRVFVSDNCKEILPDYLTVLKGAIDSPDIPLNVSRSYLQMDPNVRQLSAHISKKVSDRLSLLYKSEKESFITAWPDIEMIVKLGVLQDEKFYERVKDFLLWKNSMGGWTTLPEYLERAQEKKVYYTSFERASPLLALYQDKQREILFTPLPIDIPLIHHLEEALSIPFQRIDGALEEALLDKSREKTLLDSEGKTEASRIASFIGAALQSPEIEVEAKSLASNTVPALLILDEKSRRLRDYMTLTQGQAMSGLSKKQTLVINTNSPLIQAIAKLQTKQPAIAEEMARGVLDLSRLSQAELESKDLEAVLHRQTQIWEKLVGLLA